MVLPTAGWRAFPLAVARAALMEYPLAARWVVSMVASMAVLLVYMLAAQMVGKKVGS
jgi:hypothetical protein